MPPDNWPPPGFPLVSGDYALTATWKICLPAEFSRRVEDGSLVLWRPGLTIWLAAWGNDHNESQHDRVARAKQRSALERFDERQESNGAITRYGYRLRDTSEDGPVESINALVFADDGHLQLSVYFDAPSDEPVAWQIVENIALRQDEPD